MFDVGQRVICVNGRWGATTTGSDLQRKLCPNLPRVGSVYTIRTVEMLTVHSGDGPVCHVRLVEVVNPFNGSGTEPVFQGAQFRPLGTRETDIGFAHEILRKFSRKVKA